MFGFPDETKFSITPEIIFEGDTVTLMCENEVFSTNVSWTQVETGFDIQNSTEASIYTSVLNNMTSVSRLIIRNITRGSMGGLPWSEGLRKNQMSFMEK